MWLNLCVKCKVSATHRITYKDYWMSLLSVSTGEQPSLADFTRPSPHPSPILSQCIKNQLTPNTEITLRMSTVPSPEWNNHSDTVRRLFFLLTGFKLFQNLSLFQETLLDDRENVYSFQWNPTYLLQEYTLIWF